MSLAEFDADVVIDARDCILGRVASEVAQRAMAGAAWGLSLLLPPMKSTP